MNEVNKTLYIPLYGKSYVSKKGVILDDKKAEEIWKTEQFPLTGKAKSKWLAYYMGIRSAVFDEWTKHQTADNPDAVVIHIGCGMDSRVLRAGTDNCKWYDIDFPAVIEERKRYYSESDNYKMIAADARNCVWSECIPEKKYAIVIMEGVSMYLTSDELKKLTANLCDSFERCVFLMDCYTVLAAKISKHKNPVNDVGVTEVFGTDNPESLQHGKFVYVKEHEMTPQKYIDELMGSERYIFKKVFAGDFSKKLYRLFEFKKIQ